MGRQKLLFCKFISPSWAKDGDNCVARQWDIWYTSLALWDLGMPPVSVGVTGIHDR